MPQKVSFILHRFFFCFFFQLSADDIELPTYARLRREVALEKARHRRESLQSLEDDFQKLKTLINLTKELTLEQNNNNDTLNTVEEECADGCQKNCIRRARPYETNFDPQG